MSKLKQLREHGKKFATSRPTWIDNLSASDRSDVLAYIDEFIREELEGKHSKTSVANAIIEFFNLKVRADHITRFIEKRKRDVITR